MTRSSAGAWGVGVGVVALGAAWAVAGTAQATAAPSSSVTICHANGSGSYNRLTLPAQSVLAGHAGQHPDDIIPPFSYGPGGSETFPGQNWGAVGIVSWLSGCRAWTPPEPPDPPDPPTPPPPKPVVPKPLPVPPTVVVTPVTFCLATADGFTVRTEKPVALVQLVVQNPQSIVPPFMWSVNALTYTYPGLNWGVEGQAIWDAGCVFPPPPAPPPSGTGETPQAGVAAARVAVTITPSTYRPRVGSVVTFAVRGGAGGSEDAVDTRMCARVPATMRVVSVAGGTRRAQTACWLRGVTGRGSSTRYFRARVAPWASGLLINARAVIDATNTAPARSMTTLYPIGPRVAVTG